MLIYAEPKTGKTTFCSKAPEHFFLATEEGHDFIPKDRVRRIHRWDPDPAGQDKRLDFKTMVRAIYEGRKSGKLKHRSVTIDTIDQLSNWCLTSVCARYGVAYPGDRDGKLWKEMHTEWAAWIDTLLSVVTVRFITHSADDKIDMKGANGLTVEVKRRVPTFKGNKFAQAVDSRVNAIAFAYVAADGRRFIEFSPNMGLTTGSRISHLDRLGSQPLDWEACTKAYTEAAAKSGIKIRSKWT